MLIPQSLAYASLAGVPAYHGLYAAALPLVGAALFASSPYLQTGPGALTGLLCFGALAGLAIPFTSEFVALAALLAVVVGLTRLVIGMIGGGWISYLLSEPLLTGFVSAAALLILSSQLPAALGVESPEARLLGGAIVALRHAGSWDPLALGLTAITLLLMLGGRRLHPLFPGVLVAAAIGMGFSVWSGYGGAVIGEVPAGLPRISLNLPWSSLPHLLVPGVVIAVIGFAEPSSIARTYAALDRMPWDPNREFISQGVANLASGISGGFPVGGSFARSAVNRLSGARTRWSGAVAGLAVLGFLPVSGILASLPRAVLAGIVAGAVVRLIHLKKMVRLYRYSRVQAGVAWVTFLATLVLAPRIDQAILIGVLLSAGIHLWREMRVTVRCRFEEGAIKFELMGVLFFGSAPRLEGIFNRELAAHPTAERLVIDLSQLGRIDYSGAVVLKSVLDEAREAGLETEIVGAPAHSERILRAVVGEPGC